MAEAAQERVQSSMTSMVDDIDKSYLRKMQVRMLQCYTKDVIACWYIDWVANYLLQNACSPFSGFISIS